MGAMLEIVWEFMPIDKTSWLAIGVCLGIFGGSLMKLILVSIFPQTAKIFAIFDRTTQQLIHVIYAVQSENKKYNLQSGKEISSQNKKLRIAHKLLK